MIEGFGLVAALVLAALALKLLMSRRSSSSTSSRPSKGSFNGPLSAYFDKIEDLDTRDNANFLVSAMAGSNEFVQIRVDRAPDGSRDYRFDFPLIDWPREYVDAVETEAVRRGLLPEPLESRGIGAIDLYFSSREEHERFARWVVQEVFRVPESARFQIDWDLL